MPLEILARKVKTEMSQQMTSCVLIFDTDGYVLATARKDDSTAFGMPGGKLEINDDFYQASIRETQEETGVDLRPYKLIPIFRASDGPFDVITFILEDGILPSRPALNPNDGEGICRWITVKDLASGFFPIYNVSLLKSLPDNLKKFYNNEAWFNELEGLDITRMSNEDARRIIEKY